MILVTGESHHSCDSRRARGHSMVTDKVKNVQPDSLISSSLSTPTSTEHACTLSACLLNGQDREKDITHPSRYTVLLSRQCRAIDPNAILSPICKRKLSKDLAGGAVDNIECAGMPLDLRCGGHEGNQMMDMMERKRCGGVGAS